MSARLPITAPPRSGLPPAAASVLGMLELEVKQRLLQAYRLSRWLASPRDFAAPERWTAALPPVKLGEVRVPVGRGDAAADPRLEAGKRHNLELAVPRFDRVLVRPDRPFSFWRTLGRVTANRGFRAGLSISGGCLVPTLGGGLCLLSNALFELAVRQGYPILERHGHTQEAVPPEPGVLWGLDSTVFWPYVDLRFTARGDPAVLSAHFEEDDLCVALHAERDPGVSVELLAENEDVLDSPDGPVRRNRIRRRVRGAWAADEIVAQNRRRLLDDAARSRTCLTCDEATCLRRESLTGGLR